MTRLESPGRFGPDALNSSKVCPDSGCTASQSWGPGFGIGQNSEASAENARRRTGDNPDRSPMAARLISGLGGSKAMVKNATQRIAPVFHAGAELSTSYETGRQPARFPRACCKARRLLWSARRAQRFAVPSKNPASRAGREGIRPFRARAQRLSTRARAIPERRQFECRACDSFLSRASSIHANRRGKVLHLCKARFCLRPQAFPTKLVESVANDCCSA